MTPRAQISRGAFGLSWSPSVKKERAHAHPNGFTLLEVCVVIFIIALMVGLSMPSIKSALAEQAVRNDSRQIAVMVRTAMLQSNEQHRPFAIDLTSATLNMHPVARTPKDESDSSSGNDNSELKIDSQDYEMSHQLAQTNRLTVPDSRKANAWAAMPATTWIFHPGELCPATRMRLQRGESWLELNFNALTGNVESESSYFP